MVEMTKAEWSEVFAVLGSVPRRFRTEAWGKAVSMVKTILDGKNNIAPAVQEGALQFSVKCETCKRFIKLDEDYVYKAVTGTYTHYDCHMRY